MSDAQEGHHKTKKGRMAIAPDSGPAVQPFRDVKILFRQCLSYAYAKTHLFPTVWMLDLV
jgi:hypothetical protein